MENIWKLEKQKAKATPLSGVSYHLSVASRITLLRIPARLLAVATLLAVTALLAVPALLLAVPALLLAVPALLLAVPALLLAVPALLRVRLLKLEHRALGIIAIQAHLVAIAQGHLLSRLHPRPRLIRARAPPGWLRASRVHVDARAIISGLDDALIWRDSGRLHAHIIAAKSLLLTSLDKVIGDKQ